MSEATSGNERAANPDFASLHPGYVLRQSCPCSGSVSPNVFVKSATGAGRRFNKNVRTDAAGARARLTQNVARMERSEIRVGSAFIPGCRFAHPGYACSDSIFKKQSSRIDHS